MTSVQTSRSAPRRAPPPPAAVGVTTSGGGDFTNDASMAQLRRKLFAYALRELRSADVAEDVTQDTMIALFVAPERYRGDARFDVYAIGVLRHKIADHFRSRRREIAVAPETIDALQESADDVFPDHSPADPGAQLDADRGRERFWKTLRTCLDTLPENTRTAFVLRDVQEWSMSAVCAHLKVTPTHASVMAHRARAHVLAHWPEAQRELALS